jgi:hypothetical protein
MCLDNIYIVYRVRSIKEYKQCINVKLNVISYTDAVQTNAYRNVLFGKTV